LGGLVFMVGVADGAAVGEEDEAAQVVERFAAVELPADAAAKTSSVNQHGCAHPQAPGDRAPAPGAAA